MCSTHCVFWEFCFNELLHTPFRGLELVLIIPYNIAASNVVTCHDYGFFVIPRAAQALEFK